MSLMERLVWDVLSPEQQTFLLRVSPFETFTIRQGCYLLGCQTLPQYAEAALTSPFIRSGRAEGRHEMHSILMAGDTLKDCPDPPARGIPDLRLT